MPTCDALVIGGGPAGLAAGIALRRRGLDVMVADALTPPIDKACGEGLLPDSRRELARLGVELSVAATGGRGFSGIHFASQDGESADTATAEFSRGAGIGIRRVDLHRLLVERAGTEGVQLRWGARVEFGRGPEATIAGHPVRYRYLIGADGETSQVRRRTGLEAGWLKSARFGFRRHYRIAPWSGHVEVHWGDLGQAYITPIGDAEICVAAVTRHRGVNFNSILAGLPGLEHRLRGSEILGRDRGALTTTRKLRRVTAGNIALLGDAAGSADAITGGGLASSFRQASLLADALGRDAIADYEAGHAKILQHSQSMAAALLAMDRWPWVRKRVMLAFAREPEHFKKMLAVHIGEQSVWSFMAADGFRLGMHLLLAGANRAASSRSASQGRVGATMGNGGLASDASRV